MNSTSPTIQKSFAAFFAKKAALSPRQANA
jgi:hypothetical protein